MSGHSKWSTIKRAKGANDARRGQLFTKLSKEIIVAVRQGGGNVETNFRLRMAVQKARDNNMPNDSIGRAIKRASGDDDGQNQMEEVLYEGYGPGGTAILLETLTDNRNRTVSDVRSMLTKWGGNLADAGSVAWQFQQKGVVIVETTPDKAEELTLTAIDAGADDFETMDSNLHAYSAPGSLEQVRNSFSEVGAPIKSSEVSMVPNSTVPLDEKISLQMLRLLDMLEDLDDVQRVFSNADFPDSVIEQYGEEE